MPLELIADRPGHPIWREYEEPPLGPTDVHLSSLFSSVKHGTELRVFRGDSADHSDQWDEHLGLHRRGEPAKDEFPMRLGNMALGQVMQVGECVTKLKTGDRVFGHLPIRETHTVGLSQLKIAPDGVSPQALMYWDPADFAVGGVRDGHICLGDRVAVFGLGAIGQMVVQAARLAGARLIVGVDLFERRRSAAARHGADLVLDPRKVDAGYEIKKQTRNVGVDVAMETSGSSHALYDALRATRYQGRIVSTAYYSGPMQGLLLSGEWHRNRVTIVASRACSEPLGDYGWDFDRIQSESLALLLEGRLQADDLIDPVVPFDQAAEAYEQINQNPQHSIKLGIDYTLNKNRHTSPS